MAQSILGFTLKQEHMGIVENKYNYPTAFSCRNFEFFICLYLFGFLIKYFLLYFIKCLYCIVWPINNVLIVSGGQKRMAKNMESACN